MMENTPTLTSYEESIAPWNDDWYYPNLFGRKGYNIDDEDNEYEEYEEEDIDEL